MQLTPNIKLQNGKYRIIRVLGQGGFGITYLAEHTMLDKKVAIKEFFPKEYCDRDENTSNVTVGTKNSAEIVEMLRGKFIKEAKNISKLRHSNIITIHDIFQENGTAYYVMEYVEGSSLSQMVKENGALSEEKALGYIRKIADAVSYMHSLSMNHLDLKPANIMVRATDDEPILIDFGLSKQYDASGGQTSTTPVGISHGFAPIEQYRPGGVATFTPQTDVYALGATLYNLLSGEVPPHYSDILEDGLPELPTSVSQKVIEAVEHAMDVKKNKRPSSITEFVSELSKQEKHISIGDLKTNTLVSKEETELLMPSKGQPIKVSDESIEETMMIGNSVPIKNIGNIDNSITIDNIEFVDLGLSVKWANMNIGAKDETECGNSFSFEDIPNSLEKNLIDNMPTIEEFKELELFCKWDSRIRGYSIIGYDVIGPNGNSIYIPTNQSEMILLANPTNGIKPSFLIENGGSRITTSTIYDNVYIRTVKRY